NRKHSRSAIECLRPTFRTQFRTRSRRRTPRIATIAGSYRDVVARTVPGASRAAPRGSVNLAERARTLCRVAQGLRARSNNRSEARARPAMVRALMRTSRTPRAMILAAGFGSRLGTLGQQRPKPMLPVCGIPLVRWAVLWLRHHGIREIVVNL